MNTFQERVFSLGSWFDSNRLIRCQGAKTFEMRMLECITHDVRHRVMEAEKKILVQECKYRKKKPKDVLSIAQQIKQEDAVGAICPKITIPAFSDSSGSCCLTPGKTKTEMTAARYHDECNAKFHRK